MNIEIATICDAATDQQDGRARNDRDTNTERCSSD